MDFVENTVQTLQHPILTSWLCDCHSEFAVVRACQYQVVNPISRYLECFGFYVQAGCERNFNEKQQTSTTHLILTI